MNGMMDGWVMGLHWLWIFLIVILAGLAIAALIKYLMK